MAKYIIHKAVNADAVKKKLQRPLSYYAENYEAQPKKDGCCAVMTLRFGCGDDFTTSRTGEYCYALKPAERALRNMLRESANAVDGYGLVLIGEAWSPGIEFNVLNGMFRRHNEEPTLGFIINDCLTLEEFAAGYSREAYRARMKRLPPGLNHPRYQITPRWQPGSYGPPQELCNRLVESGGHDGLILRDPHGTWTVGSGTTGEIVKIKRVLSYDLEVTGVFPGKGKHEGRMGGIYVDFGGKRLGVGTGFTDAQRDSWLDAVLTGYTDGKRVIVEVEALDLSSNGLLREPRFKGIRYDKLEPDHV